MTTVFLLVAAATGQVGAPFPEGVLTLPPTLGVEGRAMTLDAAAAPCTVFLFLNVECPIGNRYAPEMARIHKEYAGRGVRFYRVYVENGNSRNLVLKHGKEFNLPMTALLDPKKALANVLGVRVTPEAAVVGKDGTLKYRGRIDDQNIEHGKIRNNYRRDLRVALDEILAGKPVTMRHTAAIGCIIP